MGNNSSNQKVPYKKVPNQKVPNQKAPNNSYNNDSYNNDYTALMEFARNLANNDSIEVPANRYKHMEKVYQKMSNTRKNNKRLLNRLWGQINERYKNKQEQYHMHSLLHRRGHYANTTKKERNVRSILSALERNNFLGV